MAEDQQNRSSEDLTEDASPFRVEEYRQKGIVAQSKELTALAALAAAAVATYAIAPTMGEEIAGFMREVFQTDLSARQDLGSTKLLNATFMKALIIDTQLGFPVCLAAFFFGAVASFLQIGSIFTFEPLQPDFSRVNPLQGFKRIVSMKNAVDGLRLAFKAVVILLVAYGLLKSEVFVSPSYLGMETADMFGYYAESARVILFTLAGVLLVFSLIDFGLQKWEHAKQLRMTKQEAREEFKEREGDPQIKARIRSVQREMARKRMMQAVKKADVIITNPTHIAVAISYDKEKMLAPKVVAKGADYLAQRIKKIAADAGVPMVENVPLARTLHKTVKVGQVVPRALYEAVAQVLAYVYRLRGSSPWGNTHQNNDPGGPN